jgi:Uma2 family endonuclease
VVVYPESDGLPMADNSKQFEWINTIYDNLAAQFSDVKDVLVGGNMFWYPVEGQPEIVQAPDVFVVFGRPKGHRGSYQQWNEGGIPMTVVFEILSPKNSHIEMDKKLLFYEDHGVEEYYEYDPDDNWLVVYVRRGTTLVRVRPLTQFVSPRLGIRFDFSGPELAILGPAEKRFLSFEQLATERNAAQQQAEQARRRAEQAERRAARLAELSRKVRRQEATAEELAELDRLEESM